MSKVRFGESSVLLRVIQRYTRLDSPISTPGPEPTTLIPFMFIFTQLRGIAEDLLCAVHSTSSCEKRIKLSKISAFPQRMRWWQRRHNGTQKSYKRQHGGRERSHRKKGALSHISLGLLLSLLREKHWQKFGVLYSLNGNRHFCDSPNQVAFCYQAVSAHLQGENR